MQQLNYCCTHVAAVTWQVTERVSKSTLLVLVQQLLELHVLLRCGSRVVPISPQTLWVLLITRIRSQKLFTIRPECLNGGVICCAIMLLACCCCCSCRLLLLFWF